MKVWIAWERQQIAHIFRDCPDLRSTPDRDVKRAEFDEIQRAVCSTCWRRSFRETPSDAEHSSQ